MSESQRWIEDSGPRRMDRLKHGLGAFGRRTKDLGQTMREKLNTTNHQMVSASHTLMEKMDRFTHRQYTIAGRTVQEDRQISEGGFAFVWAAHEVTTHEEYVLKKIVCCDRATLKMAQREVDILGRLPHHPNLVRYYGHVLDKTENGASEVVLLFELCSGGHLLDLLERNRGRLSEDQILLAFADICAAVEVLHTMVPPIQHRDLKVENVLLGAGGAFKLCDFGSWSSEACNPSTMDKHGLSALQEQIDKYTTMMYRPPEMVDFYQQFEISEKVDIWMLGCILYTLMFYRHPFQDESSLAISNARYHFPSPSDVPYSQKLQDLTQWLLAQDPRNRPTAQQLVEILEHFHSNPDLPLPTPVLAIMEKKQRHRKLYETGGSEKEKEKEKRRSGEKHREKTKTKPKRRSSRSSTGTGGESGHSDFAKWDNAQMWPPIQSPGAVWGPWDEPSRASSAGEEAQEAPFDSWPEFSHVSSSSTAVPHDSRKNNGHHRSRSQSSTRKRERWPDGWDTIVSPTAESTTWATWPDSAGTERTRSLDRGRQSSEKSAIFNASFASWPPPTCPHRKGLSDSEGPVFAKTLSGAPCPPPVPLGKFSHKRACSDATGLAKSSFTTNKYPLEAPSLMHLTAEAWTPWPRGICENGATGLDALAVPVPWVQTVAPGTAGTAWWADTSNPSGAPKAHSRPSSVGALRPSNASGESAWPREDPGLLAPVHDKGVPWE